METAAVTITLSPEVTSILSVISENYIRCVALLEDNASLLASLPEHVGKGLQLLPQSSELVSTDHEGEFPALAGN